MVRKGLTIPELRWPSTPEFSLLADAWNKDASIILLEYVWQAYDLLQKEILTLIDCDGADEELERSITQLLEPLTLQRNLTMNTQFSQTALSMG